MGRRSRRVRSHLESRLLLTTIDFHHKRLAHALFILVGGGALPICIAAAACGGRKVGGYDPDHDPCRSQSNEQISTRTVEGRLCPSSSSSVDAGGGDKDAGGACFDSCEQACGQGGQQISCQAMDGGGGSNAQLLCTIHMFHNCGRGFAGLVRQRANENNSSNAGAFFAHSAWMEEASIIAFRRLAQDLAFYEAPPELVRAARAAARDEARHTRAMRRLAEAHGERRIPRVEHDRRRLKERSLEEIAIENVVEACVGETYGAALALWQARHAADPEVRRAMAGIADDELRHAALGHAIAEWAADRLDAPANARVESAKRAAIACLERSLLDHDGIEPEFDIAHRPPSSDVQQRLAAVVRV